MNVDIYTDGGSRGNPGPAAWGVHAESNGETIHEQGGYLGVATNNEAEYQGFVASATWIAEYLASHREITKLTWKLDSKLVVEQLSKNWKIKEPRMAAYAKDAWSILAKLSVPYSITYVPRAENHHADRIVNETLDAAKNL